MTASVADFSSFNNQHHLDNLPGYWDSWHQNYPTSSMSYPTPTPTYNNLQNGFTLDPTLHTSSSPNSFVNPDCLQSQLQSFSAASTSIIRISSHGLEDEVSICNPNTKNKRRRASKYTEEQIASHHANQYNAPNEEPRRKSIAEPVRRERNRNAAAKCRAKSKAAEEVLKDKQRVERERNRVLRCTFDDLSNEVLALKHELLGHSGCNHPMIDSYLRRSADQISRGMSLSTSSRGSPRIGE